MEWDQKISWYEEETWFDVVVDKYGGYMLREKHQAMVLGVQMGLLPNMTDQVIIHGFIRGVTMNMNQLQQLQ
ncbi:MAG: hypothetical protein ACFFB0_16135 [Promethearchaeota archaeon]